MVLLKLETDFVSTVSSAKGTNRIFVLVIISLPIFLGTWRDFFFFVIGVQKAGTIKGRRNTTKFSEN